MKVLKDNRILIAQDVLLLTLIMTFLIGTFSYLYHYHRDEESYALNIVLTAFVTRMSGIEFLQAIRDRLYKILYHMKQIVFKRQFINHPEGNLSLIQTCKTPQQNI